MQEYDQLQYIYHALGILCKEGHVDAYRNHMFNEYNCAEIALEDIDVVVQCLLEMSKLYKDDKKMTDLIPVTNSHEADAAYHYLYPACKKAYNALRTFGDMTTIELETMTGTSPKVNRNVIGKLMKAGYVTTTVARRCKYSGRVVKTYKLKWGKR